MILPGRVLVDCLLGGVCVLVGVLVFKTSEAEHLGLAGSIPVRLRSVWATTREDKDGAAVTCDPRRRIPRTDDLLRLPEARRAPIGAEEMHALVVAVQEAARAGRLAPERVEGEVRRQLRAARPSSLRPVLNATGVIVHTNLGRAPLSSDAVDAVTDAAGYTDVELDLGSGERSPHRGRGVRQALLAATGAEDALVVNNAAAALLLATAALSGGGETIISRGELIEIGAGFRLPELIESTGVRLREVGATNRTHPEDYERAAARESARAILKVHPSNYQVTGFHAEVGVAQLRVLADAANLALIVDTGSGLLRRDEALPDEPDVASTLAAGADVVLCSGDKLLGGPQAGIVVGREWVVRRLARHPLARAVRIDKVRLAALEATLRGRTPPTVDYLHADPAALKERARALADATGGELVPHDGRVGGGGAPGLTLAGWAVAYPESLAAPLRAHRILPRCVGGRCLLDLRCVPKEEDERVIRLVRTALSERLDPGQEARAGSRGVGRTDVWGADE